MGRLFRTPVLIDLVQADTRSDIRSLAHDTRLDRKFDLRGPLTKRVLVLRIRNVLRIAGMPLPSVAPRDDAERKGAQDKLRQRLDPAAGKPLWDEETIAGLVAAVRDKPGAPAIGPATQQAVGRLFVGPARRVGALPAPSTPRCILATRCVRFFSISAGACSARGASSPISSTAISPGFMPPELPFTMSCAVSNACASFGRSRAGALHRLSMR